LTLFDPSPKSSPRDLYGRDKGINDLVHHLDEKKWVIFLGPRRIGKTSLALCALTKTKVSKNAIIDAREESDFTKALISHLSTNSRLSRVKLAGGIGVASASLDITRDSHAATSVSLGKLIDSADKMVVLIDEAQWLRNPKRISSLLAHIYDYHYNKITFMITGSAVGVMKSIIEPSAKSPLHGRTITIMEIGRWSQSESLGFLKKGCAQSQIDYKQEELSSVVERLDGIPGWLTLFGYNYQNNPSSATNSLRKTLREASRIVKNELENISKTSVGWQRQFMILKEIAKGQKRFTDIGKDLQINNSALSHNLDMLHRLGYISKNAESGEYEITDPMVAEHIA
jgi:AAA+ ATPase superfamily predicted ATPase